LSSEPALDALALEAAPDHMLARFAGARPPAPRWYEALRSDLPQEHRVTVAGAAIEVLTWGELGRPGILLVHGNRAHARWWGPVAPLLARDYRVASLSLSGMGGSDWRFGGISAAKAVRLRGHELAGVAFVDSFIVPPSMRATGRLPKPRGRHYPDLASALARFRLSPSQPNDASYILDDVARAGLIEDEDGRWRWRFDPAFMQKLVLQNLDMDEAWDMVTDPPCPVGFVFGERSALATPKIVAAQRARARAGTPSIGIPEAWHHVMFDQPFALVTVLRSLAACW
jgi:pimeloyl-ACP methyl ester carboxylesterase